MGPFKTFLNAVKGTAYKTKQSLDKRDILGTAWNTLPIGIAANVIGEATKQPSPMVDQRQADQRQADQYRAYEQRMLQNFGGTGGGTSGSYGVDGSYNPDAAALLSGRNTLREKIAALNNIYGSIYNDLNALTAEKRGSLESDYAQQYQTADKGYQSGLNTVSNNMASRGLADSSYSGQAQDQVTNTYKQDISNLDRAKQAQLAQIGQFYSQTLGGLQGAQNQYNQINPDAYTTVNDINSRVSALDEAMNSLAQQQAGLKTDSQYVKQLQGVAPAKSMTSDELSKQLQTLVTSSTPRFAKEQIAQGLIRRAQLQDEGAQAFWSDYFQKLLAGA